MFSETMEAIFILFINQVSIHRLINIILDGSISSLGSAEKYLISITLTEEEEDRDRFFKIRKRREYYFSNLFEFVAHTQTCYLIQFYLVALSNCLDNSLHLINFYEKIILSSKNQLNELSLEQLGSSLDKILSFLSLTIEAVENNTNAIPTFLRMQDYVACNTDFGYDTDFLNGSLKSNDLLSKEDYYKFLMRFISICYEATTKLL